jgi:DUF4097 and DUF4098 domain-containing protein YvlB
MRKSSSFVIVALLAVLVGLPAIAEREIQQTLPADDDGRVSVELFSGSVRFVGWNRSEVEISGTLGDDVEDLEIDSSGRQTSIEVELREGSRNLHHGDCDLVVRLPAGSEVEAETLSADVEIEGVRGGVGVESVSGRVSIGDAAGEIEVETVSGKIEIAALERIDSGAFASVSGSIEFAGPLNRDGEYAFASVSGNIVLRLPAGTSAEFDVETFSGDIDNELGPPAERTSKYVPAKELQFTLGGGDARVSVESFSGRVKLLRD